MSFRFNIPKATEVAGEFLQRAGGEMNILKLMKLIYLLDRRSIETRFIPVLGGSYLSMKNGPVISELLDLINTGNLRGEEDHSWEQHISDRENHVVALRSPVALQWLSEAELAMVDSVWKEHGSKNQWQLVEWCHTHCKEWQAIESGKSEISLENMGWALGKSPEEISHLQNEQRELELLESIFAA